MLMMLWCCMVCVENENFSFSFEARKKEFKSSTESFLWIQMISFYQFFSVFLSFLFRLFIDGPSKPLSTLMKLLNRKECGKQFKFTWSVLYDSQLKSIKWTSNRLTIVWFRTMDFWLKAITRIDNVTSVLFHSFFFDFQVDFGFES